MGEVLTTMKIMPDSPDVDLEAIKAGQEVEIRISIFFNKLLTNSLL